MTAEPIVYVHVERAVREWVRDAVAGVDRRAFFGFNNTAPFPQVRVWRIDGTDDACRFQFDVAGPGKDLGETAGIAAELATEAERLAGYVFGDTRLAGAVVNGIRPEPDPESDQARHIVDVTFSAYPAQ